MPLVTLAEDPSTGDLARTARGPVVVKGAAAVGVLVASRIRLRPGENFLRPTDGTAWHDMLGKNISAPAIASMLSLRAAGASSVKAVLRSEVDLAIGTLPARLVVSTDEGVVNISTEIG